MVNLAVKFHEHGNWARIISHFLFNMKNCYAAESAFYLLRTFSTLSVDTCRWRRDRFASSGC